jgi:4-nitrophenyl phosphatase
MRTISTTVRERFRKIRGLILDMDGVLWRGEQSIGDLPSIFTKINERGYRTVLATNNATRSVEQYLQKLENYGVQLEDWQIVTSAIATGHYMQQSFPDGGNIFVVGEKALEETMSRLGFFHTYDGKDVLAVVAALDRGISYAKLRQATLLIRPPY